MTRYILKRIGYMFLTLWVVATLTFVLINAIPGDPIDNKAKALPEEVKANIRHKYHLDLPKIQRYGYYISDLLHGNMGESIQYPGRKVNETIAQEFPVSARIGLQAVAFGLVIGLVLGILAAFYRNTWIDYLVIFIALIGVSIPSFVFAILVQTLLAKNLGLPYIGWGKAGQFWAPFKYTILPTIALSMTGIASNARFTRTSVLDVINQDYVLTAKAKGVSQIALIWKHILRNALIPVVTIIGPRIAAIITGAIVIEQIFAIPGLGRELVGAISNHDYTVIMSLTVFFALLYIVSLLLVDITYVIVDPRIKLAKGSK